MIMFMVSLSMRNHVWFIMRLFDGLCLQVIVLEKHFPPNFMC